MDSILGWTRLTQYLKECKNISKWLSGKRRNHTKKENCIIAQQKMKKGGVFGIYKRLLLFFYEKLYCYITKWHAPSTIEQTTKT